MPITWRATTSVTPKCNCMSSTRLQLCGALLVQVSPPAATTTITLCCFVGEGKVVVACLLPGMRVQVCPPTTTATPWVFWLGDGAVVCPLVGTQLQASLSKCNYMSSTRLQLYGLFLNFFIFYFVLHVFLSILFFAFCICVVFYFLNGDVLIFLK